MDVYIKTYGCTSNKFDSEIMAGLLAKNGFKITNNENADLIIVNTCAVKSTTEEKIISYLSKLSKNNKKVIIAGCLPKINLERIKKTIPNYHAIIDTKSIDKIVDAIKIGNRIEFFSTNNINKLKLPKLSFNEVIDIIKISEGCLSNCTFCATKLSRGKLYSYRPDDIRDCLINGLENNKMEFWLTSEDCSAYGKDLKISLADLLNSLVKIEGKYFIRVGMMNPLNLKTSEIEKLVETFENEKIFKFLHLCAQSFSNKVLKDMKRGYSREDFFKYIKFFRKRIKEITIETDIIVAYPTETEKDFKETIKYIKKIKPAVVNISRFSKRKGTESYKLTPLNTEIAKKRSKKLTKIVKKISLKENKKWIGWKGICIVDEIGKNNSFVGRNYCYKPIVLKSNNNILGKFINVEVFDCTETYLIGSIL
ncbi:MAG: tRNA (N(6)-L-threonylcarbamoyladenosine(37)-C(2))-methylthiotransferase [Candidatus Aenigmarchaeota archaeon]|nr:tRNA (N(6)-L-threonylcarbamoyladenosine(37)-C(2))-methylthiotransferase [Candidatus Aenigmarchaeota archaeon]MDW8149496.1 tRNA (N(6)-L-threonylcarbamoyladenosine(37)-C(2))-methylthiotransferase [Candidatus Aenigmarchaeota archaeon]